MRPVREITPEEENFREAPICPGMVTFKRDPVEPEPIGTLVLMAFRITGYDQDCDGSLLPRLEQISEDGSATGWDPRGVGINPSSDIVVTYDEWKDMFSTND